MRYSLPKSEISDSLMLESMEFFRDNNIDISKISIAVYRELFCSLLVNALDFFLEWRFLKEKEINKTLTWVYANKRKSTDQMHFYSYKEAEDLLNISLARFQVQMEKKITISFDSEQHKEYYVKQLMDRYYFHVLDAIEMDMKTMLQSIIGRETWQVFDIVQNRRSTELVSYGDFRILSWEMMRTK